MLTKLKTGTVFDQSPISLAIEKLRADFGGMIVGEAEAPIQNSGTVICRRALLVYEGEFSAMDGPVNVTLEQLMRLVENHNNYLSHMRKLSGDGTLAMKDFPPLQLDHSTSALHTVGRLVGEVEIGPYIRKDGKEVQGVYGNVCVLGAENVEKIVDGRWTHLSVGVDFEEGSFSELTITPFPAAPEASLLSNKGLKGETMNEEQKAKLKKHLMEQKKMSEEEAEKHLAKCSEDKEELSKLSAEAEEAEKLSAEEEEKAKLAAEEEEKAKLAAEEEEKAKLAAEADKVEELAEEEKKEMKKKKLTAAKAQISKLSSDFRKSSDAARLAAKTGSITARLSKLRAEAKITPAEIKKMDIAKLAAGDDKTIDAVLKVIEDREPVIMTGAFGSVKASELHTLSKGIRMSKLEEETRANMSLLKNTVKEGTKLGAKKLEEVKEDKSSSAELSSEYDELSRMTDNEELKKRMKSWMSRCLGASSEDQMSSGDTEKHLSALADSAKLMQTQFEELQKLAGTLVEE